MEEKTRVQLEKGKTLFLLNKQKMGKEGYGRTQKERAQFRETRCVRSQGSVFGFGTSVNDGGKNLFPLR